MRDWDEPEDYYEATIASTSKGVCGAVVIILTIVLLVIIPARLVWEPPELPNNPVREIMARTSQPTLVLESEDFPPATFAEGLANLRQSKQKDFLWTDPDVRKTVSALEEMWSRDKFLENPIWNAQGAMDAFEEIFLVEGVTCDQETWERVRQLEEEMGRLKPIEVYTT